MRVIAGKWRGRKLASLKGERVRPTTDRVKEAMFSILGPQLVGATVLDLCCGTGSLGIEALSRGARKVYFVDNSRQSLAQVHRNLEILNAIGEAATLCPAEAVRWFAAWEGPPLGEEWLLVSDPPYASGVAREILVRLLGRFDHGEPDGGRGFLGAVVEHDRKAPPAESRDSNPRVECRHYGGCGLTIVRPD